MLNFKISNNKQTGEQFVETTLSGKSLLTIPQLNKGTAFSHKERRDFGLLGKLPHRIETLDEQVERAYLQFLSYKTRLQQNIYLNNLHDKNQVLFYQLLSQYLDEMLPIIYTPIVGTAVKRFSHEYRQPRGLYIAYSDIHFIDEIITNRTNPEIDLIVVTDGEGVLGIGDQGIGGMDIPVAKLMVYSLCGGINPTRTLPIFLDVGTNNQALLDDPLYLGCRHPRIVGKDYDQFIAAFVNGIHRHFPNAFLHWEDFGRGNARRLLDYYEDKLCTFNDDIQGTGAVTLAALLAACHITKKELADHRIVIFGAGSAGTGIADQLVDALLLNGLSKDQVYKRFWLIDRQGLLLQSDNTLTVAQRPYARPDSELAAGSSDKTLSATVQRIKPTILIGCSAQPGAFSQAIIETMSAHCERPIIFPLSNPDEKCEATPADILSWTDGRALIATGTAFPAVHYKDHLVPIAQCNNALVFPGIGLGIVAVDAKRLSKGMILAAAETLAAHSLSQQSNFAPLLPSLNEAQVVAKQIAVAVANIAIHEGLAQKNQQTELTTLIDTLFWRPSYLPFRRTISTHNDSIHSNESPIES
ncbi:MAG: NAD-dependent malic enzyme [Legionellales bacterium RIFCSPHIGHO2_12_FULL_42_9]|nr:MAG: NAD-dependent malic enzyme [Legionellales bacterium RIFCSPHIGHO2_12_FULL_42_9]